jgi:hypothetical protein
MGSEYYKNWRKGVDLDTRNKFKKTTNNFYLDTYKRLTSHIIEFLKIISEKNLVLEF